MEFADIKRFENINELKAFRERRLKEGFMSPTKKEYTSAVERPVPLRVQRIS